MYVSVCIYTRITVKILPGLAFGMTDFSVLKRAVLNKYEKKYKM